MLTNYLLLSVEPYAYIDGEQFDEVQVSITKDRFLGIEPRLGQFVFSFSRCTFKKLEIVNPEAIPFPDISIAFTGCYIGEIEVKQILSENASLNFISCFLNGKIENSSLQSLQLLNCYIHSGLFLLGLRKIEVTLARKVLNRELWISLLKKIGMTSISTLRKQKQSYHVHKCKDFRFTTDFEHQSNALGFIFSLNLFYGMGQEDQITRVENGYFGALSLHDTSSGKIHIDRVRTDALYLHNFSPKDETSFYNIKPISQLGKDTKFEIHQCDLDNVWFDTVAFGQYASLAIYRSKLNKTTFTGCTYPIYYDAYSAVQNIHELQKRSEDYDKDLYEMFLQLKNALDGTGNGYESLKFQAFSLRALNKVKGLAGQDRFLLGLNNLSNRHGLSIARPFWWFIGLSVAFYVLYLLSLGRIFTRQPFDSTLIGYYFSFLDITHRNDFLVNKTEFTGFSLAIDYFAKLVFGYLIYQFVAAFRKYSKKL
jgi:hypothetical protein